MRTGTSNVQLNEKLWIDMIEKSLKDQARYLDSYEFYIELKEMYDKQGNLYYQEFPRLAVNFK